MISTNATGSSRFHLKAPKEYFSDKKTVALLTAALAGDLTKARQLVAEGANPNDEGPRSNPYNRLRLLHYAIAANNERAVRILISLGADPELSAEGYGRSFLFAMTLRDIEMFSLLLNLRPVKTLSKDTLEYLLFESVTNDCPRCLDLLLKRGAPIDFPDGAGYTIMMAAMDTNDYDLAEWLLSKGASVNVETKGGVTPAYSAEFHLRKYKPGSPAYNKVLHLKMMMKEKGAKFPPLSPTEVKARRAQR